MKVTTQIAAADEMQSASASRGWRMATLAEVCEVNPSKPKGISDDLEVTFVPMPAVDEVTGSITAPLTRRYADVRKGYTAFRDGDVLMAKITPCMENGKAAIARGLLNGIGFGSTEFHVLRPKTEVVAEYVYHFIRQPSFRKEAEDNMTGSVGQKRVPVDWLRSATIPVPPIEVQHEIVHQINAMLPRVRSVRDRIGKARQTINRFRRAVLGAAYSGQLTAEWREQQKVAFDEWKQVRLDSIFVIRTGGTPSRKNRNYYSDGTIPWVKTGEVQNCDIHSTEEKITERATKESNAKIFPTGTLLIAMYGEGRTRGQVGWLRIPATTNQACAALINEQMKDAEREFVFYFLLSQYEELRAKAMGGNQPNLNLSIIKAWQMPFPSLAEQSEIMHRVRSYFDVADRVEQSLANVTNDCEIFTASILSRAFNG